MGMIASLFAGLFGGGRNVIAETAGVFRANAEAEAARSADQAEATLAQFAAEFSAGRGPFDRLVDGINRLPRPALAFGAIGLFAAAMFGDPAWFAARMQGLALVPEPLWWLLGTIVSFYFGARELSHFRGAVMQREAARVLNSAPQVAQNIATLRDTRPDRPGVAADENPALPAAAAGDDNPAVADFLKRTGGGHAK